MNLLAKKEELFKEYNVTETCIVDEISNDIQTVFLIEDENEDALVIEFDIEDKKFYVFHNGEMINNGDL